MPEEIWQMWHFYARRNMADVAFLCQKKYGRCGIFMPEEIWQMWQFNARRNMTDVAF
jgi:hypothetical protein